MVAHAGRASALAIGAGLWLSASMANAGNGTKPRILVDWTEGPCMTIVDRSVGSEVHFEYSVSQEDTELTADEVDDSRRHQFFALCQAHDPQTFLPRWITQADVDRAVLAGAAPDNVDPEDIFESSSLWADCFERINADDDRFPITFAAAAAGVDWDTTGIAAGTYGVEAYTWEPALNVWSARPGVVKVIDDPALSASGPALAINNTEEVINKNDSVTIEGCVSTMDGSTITAYWGLAEAEVAWQPFIENDPVTGESYAVEFTPPEQLAGESAMIRVDVTDPMGRSYTNYMRDLVIVLGTDGPGCNPDGGGFIGGAGCEDTGGSTGSGDGVSSGDGEPTSGTSAPGTATTPGMDGGDDGSKGCGCRTTRSGPPLASGLLLLTVLGLRRRSARA